MGKLYFHCGDFDDAQSNIEILGSLRLTGAQMSQIGKDLRAPEGESERHVFSNNQDVFHGLQLAVISQDIATDNLVTVFRKGDTVYRDSLNADGIVCGTFHPGFFDQPVIDMMDMLNRTDAK
jgi:hypothetical protein